MVPPDGKELSPAIVNQVIASRKSSVRICYQESLRSNERLRGKVIMEITVKPNGDVAKVNVLSREHRSGIGSCIAERMRDWKFPTFEGQENAIVQAGFVLEKDF
jgi:Na+-translocating ferredoxin:NAD+ oxidoreductase RnfG subunit